MYNPVKVELRDEIFQKLWWDLMRLYEPKVRAKIRLNLWEPIQREIDYIGIIRTKINLLTIDSEKSND